MSTEAIRHITLGRILDETVSRYPDEDAVIYVDREFRLTWKEFGGLVDDLAKGLMALGIQRGEKLVLWATNLPYWVAFQFATAKIGAVLLPLNTSYKSAELEYALQQSEAENIFVMDRYYDTDYILTMYEKVPELRNSERGKLKSAKFPHLKRVGYLGAEKHRGMYSIPELTALGQSISEEDYTARQKSLDPDDVVNMQYTSGTTGFPKGVMLTHKSIGNNGFWIGENQKFTHDDRLCLPVPLFHCFGCVLGVLAAVTHGTTMVIVEKFDPIMVMKSIEQERCTAVYGVPTMFIAILHHILFDKFDFSSLRTGIMAGSPCPVSVMREVMDKMYMKDITICYGLTESSPVMTQTRVDDSVERRTQTVGRAMPEVEVGVFDPETGEKCPNGTQGEICCRGYLLMKGYYKMPEATANAVDTEGWLHSGDLGVMDDEGYVSITGRLKDMIIRGGENIYPREIEEFLYTMEGVKDVQVAGVPSVKYGEELGAFVIVHKGADLTPEDVQDYCRGKIAWHKIPKYVAFVEEYPLTASGKIQKYKLREEASRLWPNA